MADENPTNDQQASSQDTDSLVKSILNELGPALDQRFQGFQGILDRRDSEYRSMLEDLQSASLSPEEREEAQASKLAAENAALKRQLDILSKRDQFPEEVDLLSKLLKGQSLEDQLSLLASFRKAQAAADAGNETVEPEAQPTPVDKNNPPRKNEPALENAAANMNQELAKSVMERFNEPGILNRLRGKG